MTAIRGYERDVLINTLLLCIQQETSNVGPKVATISTQPRAVQRAQDSLSDPAAVAELMASALRARGVAAAGPEHPNFGQGTIDGIDVYVNYTTYTSSTIVIEIECTGIVRVFDMPTARALLLRLLQLPEGGTSNDALREVEAT